MQAIERDKLLKAYEVVKTSRLTPDQHEAFAVIFDAFADFMEENTRPAAPVEGLVTVETQRYVRIGDFWVLIQPRNAAGYMAKGIPVRELVTRQNAEEVIAAKDARIKDLELSSKHSADVASNAIADMKALETQLAKMREGLRSIARQWPDTSAAKTARAALEGSNAHI